MISDTFTTDVQRNLNRTILFYVDRVFAVYGDVNKDNYREKAEQIFYYNGYAQRPTPDWLYGGVMQELFLRIVGERITK